MFFLLFLLDDRRNREAQKHIPTVDPTDPDSDMDPQHCFSIIFVEFAKTRNDVDYALVKARLIYSLIKSIAAITC
jgi:hypothetical protein